MCVLQLTLQVLPRVHNSYYNKQSVEIKKKLKTVLWVQSCG